MFARLIVSGLRLETLVCCVTGSITVAIIINSNIIIIIIIIANRPLNL